MDRDKERAGRREPGREDLHHPHEDRERDLRGTEDLRDEDELRAEDRGAYTAHYGDSSGEHPGEVGPGMRMGDTQTGEFRGHGREQEGLNQTGSDLEDEDELRVQRTEEELVAGTREREAGQVKVSKQVHTEREQLRVPTRHEEVSVERVPVNEEGTGAEIGEDEISMPVVEEEVVTDKRPVVKEEIRVRKDVVQDEELVEEDVRREEVDIEDHTQRLEEGRSTKSRREGETAETPEQPGRQAGTEQPGKEDFIDKAKRKLQGR